MLIEPKKRRRRNPVTALSSGLEEDLRRQGYAVGTIWKQRRLLNDLMGWLQGQELAMGDLSMAEVDRFMADRRAAGVRKLKTRKALGPILGYLRGLGLAPAAEAPLEDGPTGEILHRYRQFLTTERALATVTAGRYIDCLRPFLDRRMSAGQLDLGGLTPADVTSFVVAWCPCLNTGVAKLTVTALRSFLGFLHLGGVTERSLVHAVPTVARRRLAGLPKGLEPDQVRHLLAACDANTAVGCRDLAILTLLVRLGLRRGEVAGLGLDDIDWRAGTIRVRGKGDCHERVPLPSDVGHLVAEYLQHARPVDAQGRTVFVRHFAPHHALGSARVSGIVADAARRADLGRIHAHRLRHTAATELLRAGASLLEIGQLLRHRRVETTAIYAKVDRDTLRLPGSLLAGGRAMSHLRNALADYLTMRRALGYKMDKAERLLGQFVAFAEDRGEPHVRTETALAWATRPAGAAAIWASRRLAEVRIFARHLRVLDGVSEVPPADLLPARGRRATPYLYTPQEIAALMHATAILRGSHVQATYRTLIGLLAATGMRIGEAIGLDRDDFDAGSGMVTIRHGKFGKSRALPLHPSTVAALETYLRRDDRPHQADMPALLISSTGKRLRYTVVQPTFKKLLHHCGITPRSAACRPRIHDLRHSFAVSTIADDYRSGNPGSRLAILSTYLGHADPGDTYWYLSAAPELLGLAGERLERHLAGNA